VIQLLKLRKEFTVEALMEAYSCLLEKETRVTDFIFENRLIEKERKK